MPTDLDFQEYGDTTDSFIDAGEIKERIQSMQKIIKDSIQKESEESKDTRKQIEMKYHTTMGILLVWSSWIFVNLVQETIDVMNDPSEESFFLSLM